MAGRLAGKLTTPSVRARLRAALGAILLLVAPLTAGAWVLDRVAGAGDRARVDQALVETLDTAHRALATRLGAATSRAAALAADTPVQAALLHDDTARLARIATIQRVTIIVDGRRAAGSAPSPLAGRAAVVSRGRQLGQIVVSVSVDANAIGRLESDSLVDPTRRLLLVRAGRVVGGDELPGVTRLAAPTRSTTLDVGGARDIALAVGLGAGSASIVALAPESSITSASSRRRLWLVVAILATLTTAALVAALVPRLLPRNPGRDGRRERRRTRHSVNAIGEVLASTHDRDRLLQVL